MTGDLTLRRVWSRLRARAVTVRGFVTMPGSISLLGLAVASLSIWFDQTSQDLLGIAPFSAEVSRTVLSTLTGAAMTALSLVYSMVLVVFTLAAGTIAPRLLERFAKDRTNQVAVGSLGALFLHSLTALSMTEGPQLLPVLAAGVMALHSIMFLLFFVDRVSRRITIDEEVSSIAHELDAQLRRAAARSSGLDDEEMVLPGGAEATIRAERSGYLCRIDVDALTKQAQALGGVVDFIASPGDPVLEGDVIARAIGGDAANLAADAAATIVIADRRTADGDLRFSVNLLVEIALRALSPGVNDSFTAIACIDRLTASLAAAADRGLSPGVYCDDRGAARVIVPKTDIADLIATAFDPIRRNCQGNGLVCEALIAALRRLVPHLGTSAADAAERQITLILSGAEASAMLSEDRETLINLAGRGPDNH